MYCDSLLLFDNASVEMIDCIVAEMKHGIAADIHNISIEHIQKAHPVIILLLVKLFNCMMAYGIVPSAFGEGLCVPIPKVGAIQAAMSKEDFRGITISPTISKIFEKTILKLFGKYFDSNECQFGFKKNFNCSYAIFSVKQVTDHYTCGGSTVNICSMDISKAFDKVNYYCLLDKLCKRGLPIEILNILFAWFNCTVIVVKWGNVRSSCYVLLAGVRQGGVLSPFLFGLYVDELLDKLHLSGLGCTVKGAMCNAFMYADDLILLTASLSHLQQLIIVCELELSDIGLTFNFSKCHIMRVGKKYKNTCTPICISNNIIKFCDEMRYLGVYIKSGLILKFNFEHAKRKFYASVNGILSKVGTSKPDIVLSLCNSFAVPCLLYATEAMLLNKSERKTMDNTVRRLFMKLFHTNDPSVIAHCQYYMYFLQPSDNIIIRTFNFFQNLFHSSSTLAQIIFSLFNKNKSNFVEKYNTGGNKLRQQLWRDFCVNNNII